MILHFETPGSRRSRASPGSSLRLVLKSDALNIDNHQGLIAVVWRCAKPDSIRRGNRAELVKRRGFHRKFAARCAVVVHDLSNRHRVDPKFPQSR